MERSQEFSVRAGTIVALEWEHLFVDRESTTAQRDCRLEHEPLAIEFEICPVDQQNGSFGVLEQ